MKKLAIPLLLIGLLGCADLVSDAELAPHSKITEVRPGIWAAIATDGRHAGSNSGIIKLAGSESLIFDTSLTPEVGALLKDAAENLVGGDVLFVANSNSESDHVRGNQVFADDSSIMGTTSVQQDISEREPMRLEMERELVPQLLEDVREKLRRSEDELEKESLLTQLGHLEAVASSMNDVVTTTPAIAFDRNLILNGRARRVKFYPLGHAATESDAVLVLMADSVLFASDLLVVDRHPVMKNSSLEGWRIALDSLDGLDVETIIPGHGPITDKTAIDRTRQYLDMMEQLADEVAAGKSEAAELVPLPPFEELLRADRFGDNLLAIVESTQRAAQPTSEPDGDSSGL